MTGGGEGEYEGDPPYRPLVESIMADILAISAQPPAPCGYTSPPQVEGCRGWIIIDGDELERQNVTVRGTAVLLEGLAALEKAGREIVGQAALQAAAELVWATNKEITELLVSTPKTGGFANDQ